LGSAAAGAPGAALRLLRDPVGTMDELAAAWPRTPDGADGTPGRPLTLLELQHRTWDEAYARGGVAGVIGNVVGDHLLPEVLLAGGAGLVSRLGARAARPVSLFDEFPLFTRSQPPAYSALSRAEFEAAFGRGPYGVHQLEDLAAVPGFVDYARSNPAGAARLYHAQLGSADVAGAARAGTTFDEALRYAPSSRQVNVPGTNVEYTLLEQPSGFGAAIELTPPRRLDHNGAFASSFPFQGGWVDTDLPQSFRVPLDRVILPGGNAATRADLDRIAVFSGHGSPYGFQGLSTRQAADLMAEQIAASHQRGRSIDYVLLNSCSQGDLAGVLWGRTNAARFQDDLNRALANRGLNPVTTLAAEEAGALYGSSYRNLLGRYRPAQYVPPDQQRWSVSPETVRDLAILGGAGAGAGGVVWVAVRR
jgi:hypothetical protein